MACDFKKLMLLYATELDEHQNRTEGIYLTSDPVTGKPFWEALGFVTTGEFSNENGQEIFEKGK